MTEKTIQLFNGAMSEIPSAMELMAYLVLCALLVSILAKIYVKCGTSLSDRAAFAKNFVPLAMATLLIITIVKSSLALSLGLVGALSIVRFRTAIKEPEEIIYLFVCISIGLGLGAGQLTFVIAGSLLIFAILVLNGLRPKSDSRNVFVSVRDRSNSTTLDDIMKIIREHSRMADFSSLKNGPNDLEATFQVEFSDIEKLNAFNLALRALDSGIEIEIIESVPLS